MKKIFIADDNPYVRSALRHLFQSESEFYVCGEAENGQQAVDRAYALTPDLAVLDISMPVMNGLEAAHILKEKIPAMPIIMFTSHKTKFADACAAASGANAVVSKDDDVVLLLNRARNLLHPGPPLDWTCPVCGASGTVDSADDPAFTAEAVKANHMLLSPECPAAEHALDLGV